MTAARERLFICGLADIHINDHIQRKQDNGTWKSVLVIKNEEMASHACDLALAESHLWRIVNPWGQVLTFLPD